MIDRDEDELDPRQAENARRLGAVLRRQAENWHRLGMSWRAIASALLGTGAEAALKDLAPPQAAEWLRNIGDYVEHGTAPGRTERGDDARAFN